MLSRHVFRVRSGAVNSLSVLKLSARSASLLHPELTLRQIYKSESEKKTTLVPAHLLDIPPSPSNALDNAVVSPSQLSPSTKQPGNKILANSDNNGNDSKGSGSGTPEKPKTTRKKKEQSTSTEESKNSEPQSKSKTTSRPHSLTPRIKTPNDQKGSPAEKFYQSATAMDKEQILVLPVSQRPMIPGFNKAVSVKDPNAIKALRKLFRNDLDDKCVGVFLLKDSKKDTDVITSLDEIYDTGVYARIGAFFENQDGAATVILYPIHRIKIGELKAVTPAGAAEQQPKETKEKETDESVAKQLAKESLYKLPISWATGIQDLNDLPYDPQSAMISTLTAEILRILKNLSEVNGFIKEQIVNIVLTGNKFSSTNVYEEPHILADFAASISAGRADEIQDVLSSLNIEDRLQKSLVLVKRELENLKLQKKLSEDVDEKFQKRQKEDYLMEQLKGIKKELGMEDGREKIIETFRERVAGLTLPENVQKVFEDEIQKLSTLEPNAAEYNITRQYLDWISQIPWGKFTKDSYNLARAIRILNEDHHGLKDVKDRILEFIAVGKLLGAVDGKIICFVGPPGVGKTSVAKSIAKSLNREFYRFSIGGVSDVSELKGHRRTYVGALPGRVIQALKKTQTQNPLILIDEIDKIGRGSYHGDPSAALLELLDPEQNNSFLDHYMDIPVDMSKTLFVCTANTLDTIPGPLLDRMEVIEISGYVTEEKIAIAENYLAPSAKKMTGLGEVDVKLTRDAVEGLINKYCRESGVRNLKKHIEKIYRKAALNIIRKIGEEDAEANELKTETAEEPKQEESQVKSEGEPVAEGEKVNVQLQVPEYTPLKVPDDISVTISNSDLKDYVGPPVFTSDRMYEETPIGVVMGLGVTGLGGTSLYVESVLEQPISPYSQAGFSRTGQLGDTMKESSTIAYSFARMFLRGHYPENRFFERAKIHLHCPEGAIPKDGPSAGITMATSLLSLALNYSIDPTFAMTGELTLTGKVLRIGGLREKAVAAKRSGATTIFFPKDNLADWESMPDNVKKDLTGIPVAWYSEVYDKIFQNVENAEKLWKEQYRRIDEAEAATPAAAKTEPVAKLTA